MIEIFEAVVNYVAEALGVESVLIFVVVSMISNLGGRLIPDDKTGALGYLRDGLKILGLYSKNRTTSRGR